MTTTPKLPFSNTLAKTLRAFATHRERGNVPNLTNTGGNQMLQAQGIPRESVSDAVADKILANICSGVYRPG